MYTIRHVFLCAGRLDYKFEIYARTYVTYTVLLHTRIIRFRLARVLRRSDDTFDVLYNIAAAARRI